MYAIKATLRKSRKEGKPGYIVFKVRDRNGTERMVASGIPSTEPELTSIHKDYALRGLKCLYDIIVRLHNSGKLHNIDDVVAAFRERLSDGFGNVNINDFVVDRSIASIGSPFNKMIESRRMTGETYSDGDMLTVANLTGFITSLIDSADSSVRTGTVSTYKSLRSTLSEFIDTLPDKQVAIDSRFIEDFHKWLKSQNLSDTTVSFYMRMLRTILNKAKEKGIISMPDNWFAGMIKRYAVDEDKNRRNSLSKDEINKIADVTFATGSLMEISRDLFMFSFYTRGMELFDILNLTKDNIHGDVIIYNKRLSGKQQIVKIEPHAQRIIDKYLPESDGYIFSAITKYSKSREYNTLRRIITPKLAELGKRLGITTPVMFSTARNTWNELTKGSNLASMMLS